MLHVPSSWQICMPALHTPIFSPQSFVSPETQRQSLSISPSQSLSSPSQISSLTSTPEQVLHCPAAQVCIPEEHAPTSELQLCVSSATHSHALLAEQSSSLQSIEPSQSLSMVSLQLVSWLPV